jgi:rare lipoprotein A (peptidoglycan hydrolase)
MTLAFNQLSLGSKVTVTNIQTGNSQEAEVTDTGGFERLGRIADLSKGLKEAINCTDLCEVEITK